MLFILDNIMTFNSIINFHQIEFFFWRFFFLIEKITKGYLIIGLYDTRHHQLSVTERPLPHPLTHMIHNTADLRGCNTRDPQQTDRGPSEQIHTASNDDQQAF